MVGSSRLGLHQRADDGRQAVTRRQRPRKARRKSDVAVFRPTAERTTSAMCLSSSSRAQPDNDPARPWRCWLPTSLRARHGAVRRGRRRRHRSEGPLQGVRAAPSWLTESLEPQRSADHGDRDVSLQPASRDDRQDGRLGTGRQLFRSPAHGQDEAFPLLDRGRKRVAR